MLYLRSFIKYWSDQIKFDYFTKGKKWVVVHQEMQEMSIMEAFKLQVMLVTDRSMRKLMKYSTTILLQVRPNWVKISLILLWLSLKVFWMMSPIEASITSTESFFSSSMLMKTKTGESASHRWLIFSRQSSNIKEMEQDDQYKIIFIQFFNKRSSLDTSETLSNQKFFKSLYTFYHRY